MPPDNPWPFYSLYLWAGTTQPILQRKLSDRQLAWSHRVMPKQAEPGSPGLGVFAQAGAFEQEGRDTAHTETSLWTGELAVWGL